MTGFWQRLKPEPPKVDELERRWAEEDRKRDDRIKRLLDELKRYPDFASALAESRSKETP